MASDPRLARVLDLACAVDAHGRVRSISRVPDLGAGAGPPPDASSWLGLAFVERVSAPDRDRLVRALSTARATGEVLRLECCLQLESGPQSFLLSVSPDAETDELVIIGIANPYGGASQQRFLETMDRVNRAILGGRTLEEMLTRVLDVLLESLECDRAWLLYPCDPDAESYTVPMERTRPEWPGAGALTETFPWNELTERVFRAALASDGACRFDPECNPLEEDDSIVERFHVRSMLLTAIRTVQGKPWCLGIHHCKEARVYGEEVSILEAVGSRLAEGLASLMAQDQLRRSEERFRTLVEHAPEAVVILDAESQRFVDANRNAEELYGLTRDELLRLGPGDTSPELQPDGNASAEGIARELHRALAGEVPVFEWTHVNSKGEEVPCEVRLVRLPDPERQLVRGSITDISERRASEKRKRELEAQLLQAQKMEAIGQLTGGVAHDFNNILTVILGNSELALDRLGEDHPASELLREALDASRKGALLTQRLLAFSRRQALIPRAVDLGELVNGMQGLLIRSLGETVQIEVVIGAGLWKCEADPAQLESAILNLAINARDAMPEGGRLTIEASNTRLDHDYCEQQEGLVPGQYVLLAISDDGVGMLPEVLDQAFEPFYTTKGVGKGSGLGLSMVYGFVKQSRGHVKIYSEPGHGSTVKVYFPRATKHTRDMIAPDTRPEDPRGNGEWILVVEDDAAVRAFTVTLLNELGYRTNQASDAAEALDLLSRKVQVDLLLTDVVLPGGMNGVELARQASGLREGLLVLYTSGYTENAIIHQGRLDPGVQLLGKPFSRAKLARSVRGALDAPVA